jgi:hypothetical protein
LNLPMRKLVFALMICFTPACSNHDDGPPDMAMAPPDLSAPLSQCGHPGDKGNSLGVGKFCTRISDCTTEGAMTNICSSLGNGVTPSPDDTYFCTIYPCHKATDGGTADSCGENATCTCGSGGGMSGCACTPNSCLGNPDGGH